jgi:hypothetical protein
MQFTRLRAICSQRRTTAPFLHESHFMLLDTGGHTMTTNAKRWFLGICMMLVLAVGYAPAADAQVVVRVGPRYHHHYRHAYYRHHHRYYR